ncbi:MAG: glycosyltransferase family 4 protein [Flavobacteriales bacterium]
MQKPNVLLISSWYPSREHPTLGNFVQRHAEAINPFVNLYVVCVISSEKVKSDFEIENSIINGVNTTLVYYKKVTSKIPLLSNFTKFNRYRESYQSGIECVEKQFKVTKWNVTHCNVTFPAGMIAYELKKKRNIPFILTEHWTLFLTYKNDFEKLKFFVKRKMRVVASEAERIVPVSNHLANSMKKRGLNGNYAVIPNVVDTDLFSLGTKKDNKIKQILHVSTLVDDHKNISGIFRTLKKISDERIDFKLIIVSDGDIQNAKQIQKSIGLEDRFVEYHTTKTPQEIVEFYQYSDFFLLFSNYENLPVVISESHCCGLPVVSSSVGGIPEMIDKSNGLIVEPKNTEKLKEAIEYMLNNLDIYDPELIRSNAVNRYDNEVVGKQYYELYKSIIK